MSAERVNVENFVRVETAKMFAGLLNNAGALNTWHHSRQPTALDQQPVIRMNRDTLYSMAIVDISGGATLTLPDTGGRYLSVMGVNQDHYINHVFHEAGTHELTIAMFDTPYLTVAARTLVDPNDPEDVAEVNRIQDQLAIDAASSTPFIVHEYDEASYQATRNAILELARGLSDFTKAFGRKAEVDPIAHLLGTAAGWGGLPITEAMYASVAADLPVGEYKLEVGEVPVDAFWSISVYNKDGYFEPNARNLNSVNSITADKNADGTITINFGNSEVDKPNYFPISEGWNCLVRMYQPRLEVLNGSWTFPAIEPA